MAVVKLGAEVDIATGDELNGAKREILNGIKGGRPKPIYTVRNASAIGSGSVITLDLGSPPNGSLWELDLISTFGNDAFTNVPSLTGAVFAGDNTGNIGLSQLVLPGLTFPGSYNFRHVVILSNANLLLVTSGAVSLGQQLGAVARVREWLVPDITKVSGP